jgi:hypothetical protein
MRSLIEIRARRARLEDELGAELEAEKQAEQAAKTIAAELETVKRNESSRAFATGPVVGRQLFGHPAQAMAIAACAKDLNEKIAKADAAQFEIGKDCPIISGCGDYFPNALAAIAAHSKYGNDKHNPGEPLHWAFDKSTQHADSAGRHLVKRGTIDPETGKSHTIGFAWRALACLETELVNAGAPPGRAVRRGTP